MDGRSMVAMLSATPVTPGVMSYVLMTVILASLLPTGDRTGMIGNLLHVCEFALAVFFVVEYLALLWAVGLSARYSGVRGWVHGAVHAGVPASQVVCDIYSGSCP
jgi:hypothetical protein